METRELKVLSVLVVGHPLRVGAEAKSATSQHLNAPKRAQEDTDGIKFLFAARNAVCPFGKNQFAMNLAPPDACFQRRSSIITTSTV